MLLTSVIAGTSYLQWREIRAGGEDTHTLALAAKTQADKMKDMSDAADKIRKAAQDMVVQDQRIADNAKNSLDASSRQSKRALDASVTASRFDQRPWITATGFKLSEEPSLNKSFTVTVGLLNTGKTPALNLVNQSILAFWNSEPPEANFIVPATAISKGMLSPGITQLTFTTDPMTLTTTAQIEAYTSKTNKVYIQAIIRYTDTFRRDHWTRVCAFHSSETPLDYFQYCQQGNEIDQGNQNRN